MRRFTLVLAFAFSVSAQAQEHAHHNTDKVLDEFQRIQLTDTYYSEGASFGDIDNDGVADIVHGPFWFAGPDFRKRHAIYPARAQDRNKYADHFFAWVRDFDGDGWNDVLAAGFPGTPAYVYQNPGAAGHHQNWPKHTVFDWVSNESPQFTNLVGDDTPELVCTRDGKFGYVTIREDKPFERWGFHAISEAVTAKRFGHGLGVGDVNGDGRPDVLMKDGWFEQPQDISGDPLWKLHKVRFAAPGGADMFAYDVDGDGDNDVITSLHAHAFGLVWHEQTAPGEFRQHTIMGSKPSDNRYGVLFSEPHSVNLVDIDGDGLKDIVTGKTYWSHHKQAPMWDTGAVVYWFRLVRNDDGVDWLPFRADSEAGIGRQLTVGDVNGDKLPDIVVGGMKGAHVLLHRRRKVSESEWAAAQPIAPKQLASGLSPEEAAKNMTVPPGFKVQLAAGEPMVHQPIAFTFDDRGRLWLAEAYTYPTRAKQGEGKDKIVILEDTDLDGDFDKRTVFIEGLNLVSGLEVGFGGVWVGAAPYLMFIPDRDGDDKPDGLAQDAGSAVRTTPKNTKDSTPTSATGSASASANGNNSGSTGRASGTQTPETRSAQPILQFPKDVPPGATVLLDGFGWHDTHETLNAFIWGPDGWLYGCHGVFTHSKVGKPGTPEAKRTKLNAGVWRYHPQRHEFEVFAEGTSNPWGVDFNEKGDAFITACVIPHLYHVFAGGRYQRQAGQHFNPHTYDDIKTIADHSHFTGNIKDHAWWGHEPDVPKGTDDAGGGHAHCGAMIYLGDNWPKEYRGKIFFNNIHGNRVNCDILEPKGSGYVGRHGKDFLKANDRWFRGINLKYAPDGTVYLIDWYDKNACHRTNPEIWDRTNGRIYRIVYGDKKPERVNLGAMSNEELVKLHMHENEWFVRMSRRLLQERGPNRTTLLSLDNQMGACLMPAGHALLAVKPEKSQFWLRYARTLDAITTMLASEHSTSDFFGLGKLSEGLADANSLPWRLHRAQHDATNLPELTKWAKNTTRFDDVGLLPRVRLSIASSLQRAPLKNRWRVAEKLILHAEDATDHNLPLMYWYAIEPLVPVDPARAMKLAEASKIPLITRYIYRRAASDDKLINHVVAVLAETDNQARKEIVLDEMSRAFEGRVNIPMPPAWQPAYAALARSEKRSIRDKADRIAILLGDARIFPRMRKRLADKDEDIKRRREALDILVRGRDAGAIDAWLGVLSEPRLRGPAIRAMAAVADSRIAPALIAGYASFSENDRRDAVSTLVARPTSALRLLDAIEAGKVPSADLHAYHIRQLERFNNKNLAARIRSVWGEIRETSGAKKERIAALKKMLQAKHERPVSLGNGRRLFDKTCASCHTLFGAGAKIGPDITGSNRANLDYLLDNIVDPSAVLGRDYRMTTVITDSGRQVSGLIEKETDSAVTLRTINDSIVVAKADIDERVLSDLSLMPEGLLETLQQDEIRDLVAYLAGPAQVAPKGPRAPIDAKTHRVPGAIEGETMKVIGKTHGKVRNQPMANFKADRWSNHDHLWWTDGRIGSKLTLELPVSSNGNFELETVMTKAHDYAVVQLRLDGKKVGPPIDLFNRPDVITTGVLSFPLGEVQAGNHRLEIEIVGMNPKAVKLFMFGLDYVRLRPVAAP